MKNKRKKLRFLIAFKNQLNDTVLHEPTRKQQIRLVENNKQGKPKLIARQNNSVKLYSIKVMNFLEKILAITFPLIRS